MNFNTVRQIYIYITKNYGCRGLFISDAARTLQVSYKEANILTMRLGYFRGKRKVYIRYEDFVTDPKAKAICEKILNQNKAA